MNNAVVHSYVPWLESWPSVYPARVRYVTRIACLRRKLKSTREAFQDKGGVMVQRVNLEPAATRFSAASMGQVKAQKPATITSLVDDDVLVTTRSRPEET